MPATVSRIRAAVLGALPLGGGLLLLAAGPAPAQQSPDAEKKARQQAVYRDRRDAKLKEPWIADVGWSTDFAAAKAKAAAEKKLLLAFFTRSFSSCDVCERFEGRVLASDWFKEYSKGVVLYLHLATKVDGEKDADLLKERPETACHYAAAMDADGFILTELREGTRPAIEEMVKDAEEYRELRALQDPSPADRIRILRKEYERNVRDGPATRAKVEAMQGLDAAAAKEKEILLGRIVIVEGLERWRRQGGTEDFALQDEVMASFLRLHRAGPPPLTRLEFGKFYGAMLAWADRKEDADVFGEALAKLESREMSKEFREMFVPAKRKRLEELRKKAAGKTEPPR